jgi:autoinducer 2-degrading protein
MHIVLVDVKVKQTEIENFKIATKVNAENSNLEKGIARFDVIQDLEDPAHFILMEIYRTSDDPARHKETVHYKFWRETVEPMMTEPRVGKKYSNIYPSDDGWDE